MPGHIRDLRKRKSQPYTGAKPWQARWRNDSDHLDTKEKSFRTKGEARDWLDDRDDDLRHGRLVSRGTPEYTLGEVLIEFMEYKKRTTWQENTAYQNEYVMAAWFNPHNDPERKTDPIGRKYKLGRRKIATITTRDIEQWRAPILDHRQLKTVRKLHNQVSQAFRYAKSKGYIAVNPCADVAALVAPPPKHMDYTAPGAVTPRTEGEGVADPFLVLTPAEIRKLADAFEHRPYAVAIEFDAWMGLRASELWGLRRRDVNLLQGTVDVNHALKEIGGVLKTGPLKTKTAYRVIKMPKSTLRLITEYMNECVGAHPDSLLFTTPGGGPVRHMSFYTRTYKPIVRRSLPDKAKLTFKDLRHTAASLVIATAKNAGALISVKQRLGHNRIETTINIYTHLLPHQDEGIAEALDELYHLPNNVRELNPAELASV
jgi:integrase